MDIYRDVLLDATKHPQHYGKLEGADITNYQFNPSCGDEVTVYIKLSDDKITIKQLKWEGSGCAVSRAAMSVLSAELQGKSIQELQHIDKKYMENLLGFEEVTPGREKCMMIGSVAVRKAISSTK